MFNEKSCITAKQAYFSLFILIMLTILEIVKLCNKKAVFNWKLVIQIKQLLFLKTTNVAKK